MASSGKPLNKILYVAMRYDYGDQRRGLSFEYTNFFKVLERLVPSIIEFDFMSLMQKHGKQEMNRLLLESAERESPDLIFFILFTDEIFKETLKALSKRWETFNWFCDDHWRFSNYSKYFAPYFSYISTTDAGVLEKYEKIGYGNVFLTQWACNHFDYMKIADARKQHDVTFVGQPHGNRKRTVHYLGNHHINVETFGQGWKHGRVSQDEMIRIFNESKINLNLSNSSLNIHTLFRNKQQIKGRNFEIPGCGGFLVTNYVDGLERYFDLGNEVVCFTSKRDLLEKIHYYLGHDEERDRISLRGYERTLRNHTYKHRFTDLFRSMGFSQ